MVMFPSFVYFLILVYKRYINCLFLPIKESISFSRILSNSFCIFIFYTPSVLFFTISVHLYVYV